jgi:hypothetical protein
VRGKQRSNFHTNYNRNCGRCLSRIGWHGVTVLPRCEICKLLPRMLPQIDFPGFCASYGGTKYLKLLAPRAGFEPATNRLTVTSSAIGRAGVRTAAKTKLM